MSYDANKWTSPLTWARMDEEIRNAAGAVQSHGAAARAAASAQAAARPPPRCRRPERRRHRDRRLARHRDRRRTGFRHLGAGGGQEQARARVGPYRYPRHAGPGGRAGHSLAPVPRDPPRQEADRRRRGGPEGRRQAARQGARSRHAPRPPARAAQAHVCEQAADDPLEGHRPRPWRRADRDRARTTRATGVASSRWARRRGAPASSRPRSARARSSACAFASATASARRIHGRSGSCCGADPAGPVASSSARPAVDCEPARGLEPDLPRRERRPW